MIRAVKEGGRQVRFSCPLTWTNEIVEKVVIMLGKGEQVRGFGKQIKLFQTIILAIYFELDSI